MDFYNTLSYSPLCFSNLSLLSVSIAGLTVTMFDLGFFLLGIPLFPFSYGFVCCIPISFLRTTEFEQHDYVKKRDRVLSEVSNLRALISKVNKSITIQTITCQRMHLTAIESKMKEKSV